MCHRNIYDDDNIPEIDLPGKKDHQSVNYLNSKDAYDGTFRSSAEPLPESERPRKDGPGGA